MTIDDFLALERGTLVITKGGRVGRIKARDGDGFGNIVVHNPKGDTWETDTHIGYTQMGIVFSGVEVVDPELIEFVGYEWVLRG